jgi:hypothetical protein
VFSGHVLVLSIMHAAQNRADAVLLQAKYTSADRAESFLHPLTAAVLLMLYYLTSLLLACFS